MRTLPWVCGSLRSPLPGSIVNPAKLAQRARDSVCEQCHLLGEARVPNPDKNIEDFRPGVDLKDVFSVAFPKDPWTQRAQRVCG